MIARMKGKKEEDGGPGQGSDISTTKAKGRSLVWPPRFQTGVIVVVRKQ